MSDPLSFVDRVAVVTGAGGGLGRAHAMLLASRGAKVVVNDPGVAPDGTSGSAGPAQSVVDEIVSSGGQAVADIHSVAAPDSAKAIIAAALETFGRVDILVNNAGILRDSSLLKMSDDAVLDVIGVHLLGTIWTSRAALPVMREQRYGRVVNTTSGAGMFGNFGQSNYSAAKAGITGFTKTLAIEGATKGIRANVLAPLARTRMTQDLLPADFSADPALPANVVAFLAHESCELNGEIISVGSGRMARIFSAVTAGSYYAELTPELVRDDISQIIEDTRFIVPTMAPDEMPLIVKAMQETS